MLNFLWKRTLALPVGIAVCSLLLAAQTARAETFSITLTNLTNPAPNSGQPFSPPVFVTHDATLALWEAGQAASPGLALVAEEGFNGTLVADLQTQLGTGVSSVVTPAATPLMPGQSITFTITTDAARPFLSSAWMLGRTNDGFAGSNALNLFAAMSLGSTDLFALDAGTEVNNEDAQFLPALGGTLNDPENGVVALHPGIDGTIGDAPASWQWTGPVARLSVVVVPEASSFALFAGASLVGVCLRRFTRRTA